MILIICLLKILVIQLVWRSEVTAARSTRANYSAIARGLGFDTEEYDVVTDDGYILTLFRMPGEKKPVLLVHGLLDSADTFIIRENRSLAVALAREGYDVWSANVRGGRYSRRHIKLNPDTDRHYWNFSFHEIGYYDLPAMIDFILGKTGETSLSAIGHSQGNSVFYVLGSTKPEYNKKISVMIALSPVCYFNYSMPPTSMLIESLPYLSKILLGSGKEEVFGDNTILRLLMDEICGCKKCYNLCARGVFFPISGSDPDELEAAFFPTVIDHYPSGTSRKNIIHLAQGYLNNFSFYDYGSKNMEIYQQTSPPLYELEKVSMKIVLLAGRNDALASVKDVELLRDRLSNVEYYLLNNRMLNHLDFIWGRNMNKYLFPYIFNALTKTNKHSIN
ncbi:unnamed protein product [Pieris macdunnoughi]|uniref:Lipase n=1 Tax=Pieris macdunnoughi TaxID=345717 RepID=A0A821VK04_9NEOP|nr:unnamed protein product [Pieris macdunnoughi]